MFFRAISLKIPERLFLSYENLKIVEAVTSIWNYHASMFNPLMHNVPKRSDALLKSCSICCKILKVCLNILGHYALKG